MLPRPVDDTRDIHPVLTSADFHPAYPLLLQAFGIRCIFSGGLGKEPGYGNEILDLLLSL